jgi:hypothetical protein
MRAPAHAGRPFVELLPAVEQPLGELLAIVRKLGALMAPEPHPDRRVDELAAPQRAGGVEALQPGVPAHDDGRMRRVLEHRQRPARSRRKQVPQPRDALAQRLVADVLARLQRRKLARRPARSLREDQHAVALAGEIVREHPHPCDLASRIRRAAVHEAGRHPARADVERRQRLKVVLEDVAQVDAARPADQLGGQGVVDDAGMPVEHDHGPASDELLPLDLEPQPPQPAHARQVARRPLHLQAVDAAAARLAVARPRAARQDPRAQHATQPAQLAQQEPPDEHEQPHRHPRLAPPQPQRQVHRRGHKERRREQHREQREAAGLANEAAQDPDPAHAGWVVRGDQHAR